MKKITAYALLLASIVLLWAGCATREESCCEPDSQPLGKSHFAKFGTNKIHYVTAGKGDHTLVFVHCWSGNLGFWREQVPAFQNKARLVLIDLPGHGESDKPHTDYTMDYFASAVLAVMRDAHVGKAALIGHSMGAPVICRVYAQAPDKVAALVPIDGPMRRPTDMTQQQADEFRSQFTGPDYRTNTFKFLSTMFPAPGTEALRDRVISELLETPQYVMTGAMDGMFGAHQPDWDPKKVNVPVLVINAHNPQWTDEYQRYVRSLSPQTDYQTIDGVGHWLMLEKPAEFNTALTAMLEKYNLIAK